MAVPGHRLGRVDAAGVVAVPSGGEAGAETEGEMSTLLERGHALLKSLVAPHTTDIDDEHAWRRCRACLASEALGHFRLGTSTGLSAAQRELQAVLDDYEQLRCERRLK